MPQPLPSGATDADRGARTLARLRGPEIQPADGTLIAEDLRAQGAALAADRATVQRAIAQSHPSRTTDLLPELEDEYGLPSGTGLSVPERQARLLAKHRARGDGSLPALDRTVLTLAPDATLLTISAAEVAGTDPSAVYRLVVLLSLAELDDAALIELLGGLLAQQLAAHADWVFGRGTGPDLDDFLCDSDDSLVELDLLAE